MSHQTIVNAKLYAGGYDLSGDTSRLALVYSADTPEDTTLGMSGKSRKGGLKNIALQHEGFWNGGTGNVDDALFSQVGLTDVPTTVAPLTGAEGELAYTFLTTKGSYSPGASVGDVLPFSVSADGSGLLIRGTLIHNATKTTTGTGTAFQLGQVSAVQKLYASLHVLAVSGGSPTLDVLVQSDTVGFPSPLTKVTFSQAVAIGSQWSVPLAGAITDDYWRVSYTIGGSTPSFLFAVTVGIQ